LTVVFLNSIGEEQQVFSISEKRRGTSTKLKRNGEIRKLSPPSRTSICVELQFRILSLQLNHDLSGEDETGTRTICIYEEESLIKLCEHQQRKVDKRT
jgi:hypothetical protein